MDIGTTVCTSRLITLRGEVGCLYVVGLKWYYLIFFFFFNQCCTYLPVREGSADFCWVLDTAHSEVVVGCPGNEGDKTSHSKRASDINFKMLVPIE